jgi:hypothetical protein
MLSAIKHTQSSILVTLNCPFGHIGNASHNYKNQDGIFMNAIYSSHQSYLLDALNADQYERLFSHLELVSLPFGEVFYESGCQLNYVYFPITCLVAKLYLTESGASTEIAVIGNKGFIGIALFMGGDTMTQELIANMLGVRRESLTDAAGKLQCAGMIDYHRDHIKVLDRLGLEAQVCKCYQVVKDEFSRLIPALYVVPPVRAMCG